MEGEGFLTSGRRTPFQPRGETLRKQAQNARAATGQRIVPQVDREIARYADNLINSKAFETVMASLIDSAMNTFEKSPYGEAGDKTRAIAHAQVSACHEIVARLRAMADDAKVYDRIEAEQAEHD